MPNSALAEARAEARPRQQGEAGRPVPRPRNAPGRGLGEGVRGAPGPEASCAPRGRSQRPTRGTGDPETLGRGCGARAAAARAVASRAEAGNHTLARWPQMPSVWSPPLLAPPPGAGPAGGARSPEPGSARGTGAASPEKAFSSARVAAGWGERTRRELQQVRLAQPSVPCPGTAVICAPHRTQLGCSPPSRPALPEAGRFPVRHRLRGGA